jgi:hypothetical protein
MHERRAWQAGPALLLPHIFNFSSLKQVKHRIKHVKDDPGAPLSMPPYGSHYRGGEIPGRWQNYAKTLGYYSSAEVSIDLSVCFTESRQIGDIVLLRSNSTGIAPFRLLRHCVAGGGSAFGGCSSCCVDFNVPRPCAASRTTTTEGSESPSDPDIQNPHAGQLLLPSTHPLPLFLLTLSASIGRVQ